MPNPYTEHGNQNSNAGGAGLIFMKFAGGQFKAGRDNRLIFEGTHLIAVMSEYKAGFIHWGGGRPIEERMVAIGSGKSLPWRTELGHNDKRMWELDPRGNPQDPWRQTESILLIDPKNNEFFQFSTNSFGGMGALRELSFKYGSEMDKHPHEWPVVSLGTRQWESTSYGAQTAPVFDLVAWHKKSLLPEAPAQQPAPSPRNSEPLGQDDMNDEVPF